MYWLTVIRSRSLWDSKFGLGTKVRWEGVKERLKQERKFTEDSVVIQAIGCQRGHVTLLKYLLRFSILGVGIYATE